MLLKPRYDYGSSLSRKLLNTWLLWKWDSGAMQRSMSIKSSNEP